MRSRETGSPWVLYKRVVEWALAVAIVWGVLALPAGYLIGRGALRADRRSDHPSRTAVMDSNFAPAVPGDGDSHASSTGSPVAQAT